MNHDDKHFIINSKLIGLGNKISSYKKETERLEQKKLELEGELENYDKEAFEENALVGKIFFAVDNLYQTI